MMLQLKAPFVALLALSWGGNAVLRYPDASFESRFPLHLDECGLPPHLEGRRCLLQLREHLLEDADCNRVICDTIHTSTPVEYYANISDWAPYKNLCGNLRELFTALFDVGLSLLADADSTKTADIGRQTDQHIKVFVDSLEDWLGVPEVADAPAYANTTRSVVFRHADEAVRIIGGVPLVPEKLLSAAVAAARRLHLLIENFSVVLLLNYHVARLEYNGRVNDKKNLLHQWYGDVSTVNAVFHDIPGKRWDSLSFLLDKLRSHGSSGQVWMAEIGVEAANTSQRLLEKNPMLSYIGVDPYVNNDGVYEDVMARLSSYRADGRFVLHRRKSLDAASVVGDRSMDLVFLDARHDFEAVFDDIEAWLPKVRPGGILSGHDFSWMFPTVAMAVYRATFTAPERTINLATDGVWWLQL